MAICDEYKHIEYLLLAEPNKRPNWFPNLFRS